MKLHLISILFSLICISILNAQWEECNNGITNGDAIWCFAKDSNNIYTGITHGVFMTTNYGDNWNAKNKGLKTVGDLAILSLAINGNNIFAGTVGDGVFLSTDKGENWVRKSNGLPNRINGYDTLFLLIVHDIIISGNNIFIGSENGIYISTDNGNNWAPKNNGLSLSDTSTLSVISFALSENLILAGTSHGVFFSSDNGEYWVKINKGIENLPVSSLAINGNNIYAGTEYGGIFLSSDKGDNWEDIGFNGFIIAGIIIKGNNIIAGTNQGVYLSTDNGHNWTSKYSGLTHLGVISMIINGDYIFAGVDNYGIYRAKLSDLGITDVKEPDQTNETKIYPNPASDVFRLKFHAPTETEVQISVFDLLGNKVLSRTEQTTEGTNEKTINCESMTSGYYYVKINIGRNIITKPFIILR